MKCDIVLQHQEQSEVYLSALLHDSLLRHNPVMPLSIVLTVPQEMRVHLIDDLHTHLFLHTKIDVMVHASAHVTYRFSMLEGMESVFGQNPLESMHDTTTMYKELNIRMIGVGSYADVQGVYFGNEKRIVRFKTLQEHQVPDATSNLVIKSVLDHQALFACHSLIKVDPGAQRSYAIQANKNILLSDQARATSIPMLEVLAHDVTCKHGAAVSRLDEEHIFYAQSRGMTHHEAQKFLVQAFLGM